MLVKNYYVNEIKVLIKYDSSAKRVVDFHSDWALSWGRPMSRFTRVARCSVSGQQMSFARKRECNVAAAEGFVCAKAQRQQDVGHEGVITGRDAFSLRSYISLIPEESPSPHSNQPLHITYIFWHGTLSYSV